MKNQDWDQWFDEVDDHILRQLPPADSPKEFKVGWTIYETFGVCVMNDYAITQVSFDETEPSKARDETTELG